MILPFRIELAMTFTGFPYAKKRFQSAQSNGIGVCMSVRAAQ